MKRLFSILMMCVMVFSFVGCGGNFSQVNLQDPIAIPENGIIQQSVFEQLQKENGIGTFCGDSNGFHYEWTVFGSDVTDARDVDLSLEFTPTQNHFGFQFSFNQEEDFGFPAVLSIQLADKWNVQSATVYQQTEGEKTPVCSAAITGSKNTILNFSVNKALGDCIILPDYEPETGKAEQTEQQDSVPEESSASQENTDKQQESKQETATKQDDYLSGVAGSDNRKYSDGNDKDPDQYFTDPVPQGKPKPVEPENQQVDNKKSYTCTFSIECSTILNNLSSLKPEKLEMVPSNGVIFPAQTVTFYEGESVYDVLQRVCKENGIHLESNWTPMYNSAYIEGIHNLYEFDCGQLSGWMYRVNGWYPNYGCSRYQLAPNEVVEWRYTCDLGKDIGGEGMQ